LCHYLGPSALASGVRSASVVRVNASVPGSWTSTALIPTAQTLPQTLTEAQTLLSAAALLPLPQIHPS
jgi:hypothetical protein